MNVLEADNNAGKSVLFKMLKITADPKYYTAAERRELIRWGTNGAIILFTFTDGTQGYTQVLPNGTSYFYNGNMHATPPKEYLEKIGLLTSNGMVANLIDTRQDLLLVDPTLSANYDLMQLLIHNDALENIRENTESNLKTYNIKSDTLAMVYRVLENQLAQYKYTDIKKREQSYEIGKLCYDMVYDTIIPIWKLVEDISSVAEYKDFDLYQDVLGVAETVDSLQLKNLAVPDFDAGLLDLHYVLDTVSGLRLRDLEVSQFDESNMALLDCLQKCADMDFTKIYVKEQPDLSNVYEALSALSKLRYFDVSIDDSVHQSILELQKTLKDMNAVYECPVYGSIVYDGETCKPYKEE